MAEVRRKDLNNWKYASWAAAPYEAPRSLDEDRAAWQLELARLAMNAEPNRFSAALKGLRPWRSKGTKRK